MTCYTVRAYVLGRGLRTFWFRDYDRALEFYYNQAVADFPVRHSYRNENTIKAAEERIKNTIIDLRGF